MSDEPQVTVLIEDPRWAERLGDAEAPCVRAARAALGAEPGALCVLLADDDRLRALNRDFRGKDAPTNVLSFALDDPATADEAGQCLGDIALAFETVAREAAEQGKPFDHHLAHLVVHGVLHLLGEDHARAPEAERMEARERAILAGLGVPDPYAAPAPAGSI